MLYFITLFFIKFRFITYQKVHWQDWNAAIIIPYFRTIYFYMLSSIKII